MDNIVYFSVSDNNNFYKIELSKTLLHFIEFDFTYFWEQCIEAGRVARKSGRLPQNLVSNAKIVIGRAHPYIEARMTSDYSEIVTDCIIEYICHSERIGLEELWARCISPKNLYESAIFRRISEYKTNRASNRWSGIVRLQEYARNKTDFIFGPDEENRLLTSDEVRARKEYFDLLLSVTANELGCPSDAFPTVRMCSPATLPHAAFAMSKVSKAIYRRFSEFFAQGQDMSSLGSGNHDKIRDQIAMDAYAYVRNMPRPAEPDLRLALEAIRENPDELYLPDSFKAILDLEFELMYRRGVFFRKCESCGRYFTVTDDNPRCDRVNSSGKTCRRQYEELRESIAMDMGAKAVSEEEDQPQMETISPIVPPPPAIPVPVAVPSEMEKRGQKLYNALYKRVGRGIDENEFREWSQYLSNMKRNLKIGEATLAQFEDFLEYSDKLCEEVKLAGKNKTVHVPTDKPYDSSGRPAERSKAEDKRENVRRAGTVPQVEGSVVSAESVEVKPFTPQAFDSLYDAFMAGNSSDEDVAPAKREKKQVEVKAPQWERLTREEVYGKKDD